MENLDIKHSVGVETLDKQHAHLIDLIGRCSDLIKANRKKEEIGEIIQELFKYTEEHFSLEERYMNLAGYKDLPSHKKQHQEFIRVVKDFEEQRIAGNQLSLKDIMIFLMDWVINHILMSDQDYAEAMKKAGIK